MPAGRRNLSLAAGIIEIAFGCLGLVSVVFVEIAISSAFSPEDDIPFFIGLIPLAVIAPSIIAIVGGVFALKRRSWAMALLGAIGVLLTSVIPGVAALVLIILGRDEFEGQPPSR